MALSIGFRMLSFLPSCYSSYGAWTLTPVGLPPTVHASLRWTHRLWRLILWNSLSGEFISIPTEVIGMQQLVKTSLEQCQRSFGMECSDRIEAHSAQRRDVTGSDGDGGEHGGYAGEGGEIVGRDTVKQAGHEVRNNKRANQAYARAGGGQSEALAQNHPEDIAPLRS